MIRLPLVRDVNPAADMAAMRAMRRLLRSRRPQVLHTHTAKAGAVGRTAAMALAERPRLVHTFHGHVLEGYFGRRTTSAFLATERALAKRTDILVAVSGEIRDQLLDLGIGTSARYRVVPPAIDLTPFTAISSQSGVLRRQLGLAVEVPLVGVIGRLAPIKNHPLLFAALRELPDVHVALIGDGELRRELEAGVARGGLDSRVHFLGWRTDLPDLLADVDAVALTSRNEGAPVALAEASAAQRPVVATDVGGVRSVVIPGVTGLVVPPGDAASLASALRRVLFEPGLGARMGRAGREHVVPAFSVATAAEQLSSLYEELLAPRSH